MIKFPRVLSLCLLVTFTTFSCSNKSGNSTPADPNTVKINGTVYATTTIGSQVWITTNYSGAGGYSAPATNNFGAYYTHNQALVISLPVGWRVPSINDYNKLLSNFTTFKNGDGNYDAFGNDAPLGLVATSGWLNTQGTNTSGFNALPSGYYVVGGGQALFADTKSAEYVTADFTVLSSTQNKVYGFSLRPSGGGFDRFDPEDKSLALRLVRDK